MDVCSFAGGFVCNAGYLANIANWSGLPAFPQFYTNQHWQFGWATWYSSKLPSRQVQFTEQQPDYREAFWGFPHVSIDANVTTAMVSVLYDRVIASSIQRLAVSNTASSDSAGSCDESRMLSTDQEYALMGITGALIAALMVAIYYLLQPVSTAGGKVKRYRSLSDGGDDDNISNTLGAPLVVGGGEE
jgi:hypothetical protein